MKKICLSDADAEFFADELVPHEFDFFQKHKDTFRCMWTEQGKSFWARFFIIFRSFTSKHGIIRDMPYESDRLTDIMDFAFIVVHENFVDGKASSAKNFLIDIARLAQNKDKLPCLDSKKFSKDPFYCRETRDIFRKFFGPPSEKISYIKVYILFPVYLRLCGSVCRCLLKWMDAPRHDSDDDSYWIPPEPIKHRPRDDSTEYLNRVLMCENCIEACGILYLKEKQYGCPICPQHLPLWKAGNPRFNDPDNPLYNKTFSHTDWREEMNIDEFRDFIYYLKIRYGGPEDKCRKCEEIRNNKERMLALTEGTSGTSKKKKKKKSKRGKNREQREEENEDFDDFHGSWVNEEGLLKGFDASNPEVGPNLLAHQAPVKRSLYIGDGTVLIGHVRFGLDRQSSKEGSPDAPNACGVRVLKMVTDRTNCNETVLYLPCDSCDRTSRNGSPQKERYYDNIDLKTIPHLPFKFEWAEGQGWCVAVLDYEREEKGKSDKYTKFTLKVVGRNEVVVRDIMKSLLKYIGSRKSRACPGWVLNEDDVLTSVIDDNSLKGITIIITEGLNYRDCLTEWEKATERQIDLSIDSDMETKDLIKAAKLEHSISSKQTNDKKLASEIIDGWQLYYDMKRKCESYLRQETFDTNRKKLMKIDILHGKVDFVTLNYDDCHRGLDDFDVMFIKDWLQLEKCGIHSKGSAKEVFRYILKKHDLAFPSDVVERERRADTNKQTDTNQQTVEVNVHCEGNHRIITTKTTCPHGNSSTNVKIHKSSSQSEKIKLISKRVSVCRIVTGFKPAEKECSKNEVTIKENRKQLNPRSNLYEMEKEEMKRKLRQNVDENTKGIKSSLKVENKTNISKPKGKVENLKARKQDNNKDDQEENDDGDPSEADNGDNNTSSSDDEEEEERQEERKLRMCANCDTTEPIFRTYKKCQRCQQEGIAKCRFYCGRDCQVEDWTNKHRMEHMENKL